jgi:hypothetical protein
MPTISRFLGIIISMYSGDHNPPHFHARYNDYEAQIGIRPLALIEGHLPPKVLGQVFEWAALHQEELIADWELASAHQPTNKIPPLA